MPPFAPSSAPSLPSERFKQRLEPPIQAVHVRPCDRIREHQLAADDAHLRILEPSHEPPHGRWFHHRVRVRKHRNRAREPRYDRVENGGLAGSLSKRDELDSPAAVFLDDVHGAIAARIGCDDELELVLWIIKSEKVVDAFPDDRLFVMSHDQDRHTREGPRRSVRVERPSHAATPPESPTARGKRCRRTR